MRTRPQILTALLITTLVASSFLSLVARAQTRPGNGVDIAELKPPESEMRGAIERRGP